MNANLLKTLFVLAASFALPLCASTMKVLALPSSVKVKTAKEAIALVWTNHAKEVEGLFPSHAVKESAVFKLARDFIPFAQKGQWCWEVDIPNYNVTPDIFIVDDGMALHKCETLRKATVARLWVNAESGETLYVAGGFTNITTIVERNGETVALYGRRSLHTQKPIVISASRIGTNSLEDVAAALFARRFSLPLPKNKITHRKNIILFFDIDGFAKTKDAVREIRFYTNKSEKPFVFTGWSVFRDASECDEWYKQGRKAIPLDSSTYTKWMNVLDHIASVSAPSSSSGARIEPETYPAEMFEEERKFHQHKGALIGTVWARKSGDEVRFYFPMPEPAPATNTPPAAPNTPATTRKTAPATNTTNAPLAPVQNAKPASTPKP